MKDETSQIERRVNRYWYSDGIGELIGGGVFFLLAAYFALQQFLGEQSFVGGLLQAGLILALIGVMYIGRRVVNTLKARITYPRTGYVEYRADARNANLRRVLALLTGMAVAALSVFVANRFNMIDGMVAVTGVLVAIIFMVKQGWISRLGRFFYLSAVSLVSGGILSVSGFPRGYNLGLFYALMGVALALSGGLTLKNYLRENPFPAETGNE